MSAPLQERPPGPHRVVIVGGGAGGLPLATRLGDTLGRRRRAEITLVDRDETHVWKPLLHEVAAGRMDADAHDVDYLALAHDSHIMVSERDEVDANAAKLLEQVQASYEHAAGVAAGLKTRAGTDMTPSPDRLFADWALVN